MIDRDPYYNAVNFGHRDSIHVARGVRDGYQLKVVVSFDDETFAEIKAEAMRRQRSFAHIVRELVELGLETAKQ